MKYKEITKDMVSSWRRMLSYDKSTGLFLWINPQSRRVSVGDVAGRVSAAGHVGIGIDGGRWQAHRLAVAFMEGFLSGDVEVDHKDQDKQNNRYENLRKANRQQNSCNRSHPKHNTSGVKGVHYVKRTGKWEGYVHYGYKKYYVGTFPSKELCYEAVSKKRNELHGDFSCD